MPHHEPKLMAQALCGINATPLIMMCIASRSAVRPYFEWLPQAYRSGEHYRLLSRSLPGIISQQLCGKNTGGYGRNSLAVCLRPESREIGEGRHPSRFSAGTLITGVHQFVPRGTATHPFRTRNVTLR